MKTASSLQRQHWSSVSTQAELGRKRNSNNPFFEITYVNTRRLIGETARWVFAFIKKNGCDGVQKIGAWVLCKEWFCDKIFFGKENTEDDLCSFFSALCKGKLTACELGTLRAAGWKAKMEAGASPARSRHCIDGVLPIIHWTAMFGKERQGNEVWVRKHA